MKSSKIIQNVILPVTLFASFGIGLLTNVKSDNNIGALAESSEESFTIELCNMTLSGGSLYNLYDDDESTVALFTPTNNGEDQTITYVFTEATLVKHIYFYGGNTSGGQLFDGHIDYFDANNNEWKQLHVTNGENNVFELTPNITTTKVRLANTYTTVAGVREFSINNYEHLVYYDGLEGNHEAVTDPYNKLTKNMVDSSYDSFMWFGNVSGATATLILDLGSELKINYVQLLMGSDYLSSVSFSYSLTKDSEYTDISAAHYAVSDRLVYLRDPITTRFIKATANSAWVKVRDFSAGYGLELSSGYSIYSSQRSGLPYSSLAYGDDFKLDTFLDLENSGSDNLYVTKNLLSSDTVKSIFVSTGGHSYYGDFTDNVTISYSLDNETWVDIDSSLVLERSGTNYHDYLVVFEKPITAQYIKLTNNSGGWLTIAEFSINSLFNIKEFLDDSFTDCTLFKKDMKSLINKIDSLYNDLTKYEQLSLTEEQLYKIDYYKSFYALNSTDSLSNIINKLNDGNNAIIYSLLIISSFIAIAGAGYVLLRRKKTNIFNK